MKENAKPDSGGGPERDELRAMLRHWHVPGTPPEIEDALRREFQRRRSPRRRALWVSLAAGVTLLVTWQMRPPDLPVRPASPQAPLAAAPSPVPPPLTVEPERNPGSTSVAADSGRVRRPSSPAPPEAEPEVIVEPAQAELLAELGRKLWGTRQAVPGTTIPQMPEVEAPRYRAEWEPVAGEWPLVHRFVPIIGR